MAVYNLDANEEIDDIMINGIPYKVGDIPVRIMEKIAQIKTGFFRKDIVKQWQPIIKEILEIRNKNVDIENITKEKTFAFIQYLQQKQAKGQIG